MHIRPPSHSHKKKFPGRALEFQKTKEITLKTIEVTKTKEFESQEIQGRTEQRFINYIAHSQELKDTKELLQLTRSKKHFRVGSTDEREMLESARHDRFAALGAVSADPKENFQKTPVVAKNACDFLRIFFEDHAGKVIDKHLTCKESKAGCISFVSLTVNGRKICLVSKSTNKIHMRPEIEETLKKINLTSDTEFIWIPFSNTISLFLSILNDELDIHNNDLFKPCAEKSFLPAVFDLFVKYPQQTQVTGIINCQFYPFEQKLTSAAIAKKYGVIEIPDNLPSHVKIAESLESRSLGLDNLSGYRTSVRNCCPPCAANKETVLLMLSWAQRNPKIAADVARDLNKNHIGISFSSAEGALNLKETSSPPPPLPEPKPTENQPNRKRKETCSYKMDGAEAKQGHKKIKSKTGQPKMAVPTNETNRVLSDGMLHPSNPFLPPNLLNSSNSSLSTMTSTSSSTLFSLRSSSSNAQTRRRFPLKG
ncbi:MAG TPA: hypothetical protein VHM20_06270, partial [Gammaproteobacteria bacterium]|nr:hypothetical protein [Gammaproteobacteria bacterium]